MKILFRTMRYNWRYIFSKSNKIAVALFSVWGFVTLVTPTDIMLNCIDNIVLRIIVAVLILMVIYFAIVIVIIPGLSEPPVRTLRATMPENGSHIFR